VAKKRKPRIAPDNASVKPPPTETQWRIVYVRFQSFLGLGSIASRRLAEKLADALDQEALEALRIGRRLESTYAEDDMNPRRIRHSRAAISGRLRGFGQLVDLARLETLADPIGEEAADWYRQGMLLLDAAEGVRGHLIIYEAAAMRPKDEQGTVAWGYLIQHQHQWGISDKELAVLLAGAGFVRNDEGSIANLTESLSKHRARRGETARKRRRRQ
jgi:hypothetical protein